jgi:hypothetical protein
MSDWEFYKQEKEEHRWGLGKYAGQREYVSAKTIPFIFGEPMSSRIEKHPFLEYANEQCDNINLVEDGKGLFCNHCCHYHAVFTLKGIKPVYQPLPQKGYDTPEQTCINPGKYRSDWTDDSACFEYGEDEVPEIAMTPGNDFWYLLAQRVSKYGLKVELRIGEQHE